MPISHVSPPLYQSIPITSPLFKFQFQIPHSSSPTNTQSAYPICLPPSHPPTRTVERNPHLKGILRTIPKNALRPRSKHKPSILVSQRETPRVLGALHGPGRSLAGAVRPGPELEDTDLVGVVAVFCQLVLYVDLREVVTRKERKKAYTRAPKVPELPMLAHLPGV